MIIIFIRTFHDIFHYFTEINVPRVESDINDFLGLMKAEFFNFSIFS